MATKKGSAVTYSDSWKVVYHYAILEYTLAQTGTKVILNISIKDYNESFSLTSATQSFTIAATLSATGYSDATYSANKTTTSSGNVATDTLGSNITRQWDRGTAAQTKTVTLTTSVNGKSSTASFSTTVPALQSWTVSFDANSGTGAPTSQLKYYNTTLTLSDQQPVKDGYTFKGWATTLAHAASGTVDYASGASYTTNDDLELFAVWELTYQKPTIDNLSAERCNSDGSANDEGSYAKISFDWAVFTSSASRYYGGSGTPYSSNGATCSVTVGSGSSAVTVTPTLTGSSGSASVVVGTAFDVDTQYSVSVSVTDTQSIVTSPDNTTTVAGILATSKFPMDFNADATAVGFFMPAPDNEEGMYLHGDLYLDLSDYNTSGTVDYDLYEAIVALGWQNDVLVN